MPDKPPLSTKALQHEHGASVLVADREHTVYVFSAGVCGVLDGDDNYIAAVPLFAGDEVVGWLHELRGGTAVDRDEDEAAEPAPEPMVARRVLTRLDGTTFEAVVVTPSPADVEPDAAVVTEQPLSLRELVDLADQLPTPHGGVAERTWDFVLDAGWAADPTEAVERSYETAPLYPGLGDVYAARAEAWRDGQL